MLHAYAEEVGIDAKMTANGDRRNRGTVCTQCIANDTSLMHQLLVVTCLHWRERRTRCAACVVRWVLLHASHRKSPTRRSSPWPFLMIFAVISAFRKAGTSFRASSLLGPNAAVTCAFLP